MHPRIQELSDYLDEQRAVLHEAFEQVPPAHRNEPPQAGRWSVAGIVEHLAIVERRLARLMRSKIADARAAGGKLETSSESILAAVNPVGTIDRSTRVSAPETTQPTGLDAETAWAALENAGAAVRDALAAGDGLALGEITIPHPLFGPMSLYEWFAFVAAHEARHADQIREAAAAWRT